MPRGRGHGPRMSNEKAKDFKGNDEKADGIFERI